MLVNILKVIDIYHWNPGYMTNPSENEISVWALPTSLDACPKNNSCLIEISLTPKFI